MENSTRTYVHQVNMDTTNAIMEIANGISGCFLAKSFIGKIILSSIKLFSFCIVILSVIEE